MVHAGVRVDAGGDLPGDAGSVQTAAVHHAGTRGVHGHVKAGRAHGGCSGIKVFRTEKSGGGGGLTPLANNHFDLVHMVPPAAAIDIDILPVGADALSVELHGGDPYSPAVAAAIDLYKIIRLSHKFNKGAAADTASITVAVNPLCVSPVKDYLCISDSPSITASEYGASVGRTGVRSFLSPNFRPRVYSYAAGSSDGGAIAAAVDPAYRSAIESDIGVPV